MPKWESLLVCEPRRQLAERFAISTRQYAEAAAKLGAPTVRRSDYPQLFEVVEEARRRAESALAALKEHVHQHQCGAVSVQMAAVTD
jgi:hypothetical protein